MGPQGATGPQSDCPAGPRGNQGAQGPRRGRRPCTIGIYRYGQLRRRYTTDGNGICIDVNNASNTATLPGDHVSLEAVNGVPTESCHSPVLPTLEITLYLNGKWICNMVGNDKALAGDRNNECQNFDTEKNIREFRQYKCCFSIHGGAF